MTVKRKIAIGLCLFLTISPIVGLYFSADNTIGKYVGNLTPYIHLTMPGDKTLFAEIIDKLFGPVIFLIGLIGFIIFTATKFRKTGGLLLLLYLTIIYLVIGTLLRISFNIISSFDSYEIEDKLFILAIILSNIIWGLFCYWSSKILTSEILISNRQDEKQTA